MIFFNQMPVFPLLLTTGAIELSYHQVFIACGLVLVAGILSLFFRLGLEKQLLIASLRTVVQLSLVGYVLAWVFKLETLWAVALVAALMVSIASHTAAGRPARTYTGAYILTFINLFLCASLTVFVVTSLIIGNSPWYKPQYMIPLLGMILGNSLNGISLCLDHLLETLVLKKAEVEMQLAHGASSWEAAQDAISDSVNRGIIPIINSMMVVGVVTLPGMMTGQILQGADPHKAVKYQIMVMFMISATTMTCCIISAFLTFKIVFNAQHQLDLSRIRIQNKKL
ncbi:ABC transporter permease [Candidatus Riflebacteria bacterium]